MLKKLKFILTKSEKKKLMVLFIGTVVLASLETFSIGIIIPIMNLFINQDKIQTSRVFQKFYQFTGIQDNVAFLTALIVGAIILFFVKAFHTVFILYKQVCVVNNIQIRIRTELLTSYLNRPYSFHLENNSAVLFRNITQVVSQFSTKFLLPLVLISADIIILLSIVCLLIFLYPLITLLLGISIAIIMVFINFFLKKRIELYSSQRMDSCEQMHKFGLEALQGVKEIKVYNGIDFFIERYFQAVSKYANSVVRFNVAYSLPRYVLELILITSLLTALSISIYSSKPAFEFIPIMMVLGIAAVRVLPTIQRIYSNINMAMYYSNDLDIVYKVLNEDNQAVMSEKVLPVPATLPQTSQDIRLENIEFRYKTGISSIFSEFNLFIPKHKTVAFAGETGAGKSTLIDILMGLLIPINGVLYYGQTGIGNNNISEYRKKIGYVPQHIFLIDDTLQANIAFGIPEDKIDHKQLEYVIDISQLKSLVDDLPEGTKTFVGEKGVRLSGGQRQRVAIARALYHNPEILIMDEATSALDGYTEAEVNKAIKNLCGKLTIVIIGHRLSTIESADIIYVMERGRIVDQGSFKELLENSTTFRKIANQIPA